MAEPTRRPRARSQTSARRSPPPAARRRWLTTLVVLGLMVGSGAGLLALLHEPRSLPEDKRRVWVDRPQSLSTFTRTLQQRGLVRHRWLVRLAAFAQGFDGPVPPAGYRFASRASAWELAARLRRGGSDFFKLTLREGLRADQVPERLATQKYARADEFSRLIAQPVPLADRPEWLPHGKIEGYLFPDTYFVDYDAEPKAVIKQMLMLFESRMVNRFRDDLRASRRSLHEIVTLASLVEREVMEPAERPVVAGVYLNRLRRRMRLECDATVQYALGYWKRRLRLSDLRTPSAYNTYLRSGLPPGPICNPGLGCLEGAMRPARHQFLYYVANGNGGHTFARTYEEHLVNVAAYRRRMRSSG